MGFGLLFIGYFIAFLMSVNNYGFAFEIVGYAIMLSAVGKLSEYKHSLSRASLVLLIMSLCSVYDGFRYLDELLSLGVPLFSDSVNVTVSLLSAAMILVFHVLLLLSIRDIAKAAEENDVARRSYLALTASALSCLLEFAVAVAGNFSSIEAIPAFRIVVLVSTLVRILYPLTVLAFIYTCYARICAPEDMDMPQRPSRFAFINRWREKREKKSAETAQLRQEYQQKLEEKNREKSATNHKKNKK